jgi:hypothetical protein
VLEKLVEHGLDARGIAPEQAECLIVEVEILRALDQDGMESPKKLVALDDVHAGRGGDGFEGARRTEAEAGAAQEAGEMDDVFGELRDHRSLKRPLAWAGLGVVEEPFPWPRSAE